MNLCVQIFFLILSNPLKLSDTADHLFQEVEIFIFLLCAANKEKELNDFTIPRTEHRQQPLNNRTKDSVQCWSRWAFATLLCPQTLRLDTLVEHVAFSIASHCLACQDQQDSGVTLLCVGRRGCISMNNTRSLSCTHSKYTSIPGNVTTKHRLRHLP